MYGKRIQISLTNEVLFSPVKTQHIPTPRDAVLGEESRNGLEHADHVELPDRLFLCKCDLAFKDVDDLLENSDVVFES